VALIVVMTVRAARFGRPTLHAQAVGGARRELHGRVRVQRGGRRVPDDAVDAGAAAGRAPCSVICAPPRPGRPRAEADGDARVEVEPVELVELLHQART
jgi:hypothetical protein